MGPEPWTRTLSNYHGRDYTGLVNKTWISEARGTVLRGPYHKKDPILWGCCCASEAYILVIRPTRQVGIDEKGVSEHKGYLVLRS